MRTLLEDLPWLFSISLSFLCLSVPASMFEFRYWAYSKLDLNPYIRHYMEQHRKDYFFPWFSKEKNSFWTIYTTHTYKRTCSDVWELCSREQRIYLSPASILIRRRPTRLELVITKVILAILVTSGQEQFGLCSQVSEICQLWGVVQRVFIQPGHKHLWAGQHHQPRRSSTRWVRKPS